MVSLYLFLIVAINELVSCVLAGVHFKKNKKNRRMADPFVPVHLAINIVNSSSLNRGASTLTVDEACRRPRGEQSDRPGNTEEEETPISATLLGYEILKEREKFTVGSPVPDKENKSKQ